MIKNYKDYKYYLLCDKEALGIPKNKKPHLFGNYIWKYLIYLRREEYLINCKPLMWKIRKKILSIIRMRLGLKLGGMEIPVNVFEEGLAIVHCGYIVINGNAKVGKYCRLQEGVTIGATNGEENAPIIGDFCFCGSGAKIIGDIKLGDNVCVGAGAVVVSDVGSNVTIGGVPAKILSFNSSINNLPNNIRKKMIL